MNKEDLKIIFFGTPKFAENVLEKMEKSGFLPTLIITAPDKPKGRKMIITPPEAKVFAISRNIPFLQPQKLKDPEFLEKLKSFGNFDISVVCSYGKIIPKEVLDIPKNGNLNIHPSLLPKLRGPSPMQSSILTENETGVTIMKVDEQMDHGPIIAQEKISINWPPYIDELEKVLAEKGAELLCKTIIPFLKKEIEEIEQDHQKATFCKKIEKEDGLIDLKDDPEKNLRKIRAFKLWPKAYFFQEIDGKNTRIIVTFASIENGLLKIEKVIPEGKKEIDYINFVSNLNNK